MKKCCVQGCSSLPELSFFEIPAESIFRKIWIDILKKHCDLEDLEVDKSPYVCEQHFIAYNFDTSDGEKILKSDAVPSIFEETTTETSTKNVNDRYQHSNSIAFENLLRRLNEHQYNDLPANHASVGVQTEFASNVEALTLEKTKAMTRLTSLGERKRKIEEELNNTMHLISHSETLGSVINDIIADAAKGNEDAALLLDQVINYGREDEVVWNFNTNSPEEKEKFLSPMTVDEQMENCLN